MKVKKIKVHLGHINVLTSIIKNVVARFKGND